MTALQAPRLNPLQKAWLQEIGLDRRLLAYYGAEPEAPLREGRAQTSSAPERAAEPGQGPLSPDQIRMPEAPGEPASAQGPLQRVSDVLTRAQHPPRVQAAGPATPELPVRTETPQDWEGLRTHVMQCQVCDLHVGRSQAVFGSGVEHAPEWMIIGEAPGSYDDRAGIPFQGKAGTLLRAMLASIGITDQTPVFYTNLIKCRPLGNRTPKPDEIAACLPYLRRQMTLLAPRRILALGELAAQAILGVEQGLEALRGTVHTVHDESGRAIPVTVTYHPAALLLRPQHKPDAWRDLHLAQAMGDMDTSAKPG